MLHPRIFGRIARRCQISFWAVTQAVTDGGDGGDGFVGVGVMYGGAAVTQRGLREAFGHAGGIGALGPCVTVAVQFDVVSRRESVRCLLFGSKPI